MALRSYRILWVAVGVAVMAGQAAVDVTERTHLVGDVPALLGIGALLLILTPRGTPSEEQPRMA